MRRTLFAALLAALVAAPAHAGVYSDEMAEIDGMEKVEFTCPISGKKFRQYITYGHFALATFSDGSHMGDQWVDTQVPVCPGNGLVLLPLKDRDPETGVPVYHEYSDEELAQLETLIASEDYQALSGETRYLRAYWLGKQLGLPAPDLWEMLQVASWSADTPEQRERALAMFAADGPELLPLATDSDERRYYGVIYIADALRQLGRFDEALEMLAPLEVDPENPEPDLSETWIFSEEPLHLRLRTMVKEENTDRFPVALQENRLAGLICNNPDAGPLEPATNAARDCQRRETAMAAQQELRDEVWVLKKDEEALAIGCRDIPQDRRSVALDMACDDLAFSQVVDTGRAMFAADPASVAALCEAGGGKEIGAEYFACEEYDRASFQAEKWLLLADDEAFEIACVQQPDLFVDPESEDLTACASARSDRWSIEGWRLWQDRENLGPACAALPEERTYAPLESVCEDIAEGNEDPYWYPHDAGPEPDEPGEQVALAIAREKIAIAKQAAPATIGNERD